MTWMASNGAGRRNGSPHFRRREPPISSSKCNGSIDPRDRTHFPSMPDDNLRHFPCRRCVAAALGADDAVDDGHADAGEVAELHAFEHVLARRVLRLVHEDEIGGAADFDEATIECAHPRGVAGRKAEGDLGGYLAE